MNQSRLGLKLCLAALAGLLTIAGGRAFAADNPATTATTGSSTVGEVVVTGSRIGRSTFTTPNPVSVIGPQEIQNLGLTNVGAVVAELPQNSNFFAGNNVGLGNFNVGAQLANLRGLNPFFGTRTLTMIDTHRVVPTTTGGGVDITLVPSILVARTEVVTGGASAVYGSDAVAGVVNIILDTQLEGFKGIADYSATTHGDGGDWHGGMAFGHGFAGGRGHFIIGGEYEKSDAIGICSQVRSWCATNIAMYTNTNYLTNGQPHYIIGPNGSSANQSKTGVVSPCGAPIPGFCLNFAPQMQFNQDGSALVPFDPGSYAAGAGFFGFRQGGDDQAAGAYDATTMRPGIKRWTGMAHADYDLTNSLKGFLEGGYAKSEAVNPVANGAIGPYALQVGEGPNAFVGNAISASNPYLTPAEAAYVGPLGAEFGRSMLNEVEARNETNNTTWRVVAGLNGDISHGWTWDAYAEHGVNKNDQHLYHNAVSNFIAYALDAARDPVTGNIVCGVNIPGHVNPNTGAPYTADDVTAASSAGACSPLNLFGAGNASQAAIDYAFRTLTETSTYKQDVLSGNVHGDLFDGWGAGPIKLAAGAEYRREHGSVEHDLADQPFYNNYTLSYGLDYAGTMTVLEGYTELNVPVIRDAPFAKYMEIDGAIRETHNKDTNDTIGALAGQSASHNFPTWKVSAIWDVTDWLRLRGTRSRDVRAPQFRELYQSYAVTAGGPFGSVNNPWNSGISDPALVNTGGNIDLKPEVANAMTGGVVFSPKSGPLVGLQLSADWYQIKIRQAIVGPPFGLGVQNIVAQCFQGVQSFCDRMTGEGTNDILTINNTAVNLQGFTTRGIDYEANYNLPLERLSGGMNGDLNFRVIASYLYDMLFDTGLGSGPVNYAGQSGPTAAFGSFNTSPKWQANAFVTYANGPFTGTVQLRYIGPGKFETVDGSGNLVLGPGDTGYSTTYIGSISNNKVSSAVYVNLSASYDIGKNYAVFGSMTNLFDKDPAVAPGGNGYPTNPVYFDTYGRTYKMGLRVRY